MSSFLVAQDFFCDVCSISRGVFVQREQASVTVFKQSSLRLQKDNMGPPFFFQSLPKSLFRQPKRGATRAPLSGLSRPYHEAKSKFDVPFKGNQSSFLRAAIATQAPARIIVAVAPMVRALPQPVFSSSSPVLTSGATGAFLGIAFSAASRCAT